MREKIIEVSLQQFLEHGIRKITLQKLVLPLAISTKTVYKYFADKEALLQECLKLHYKEIDKSLKTILADSPNPTASLCLIYSKSTELDFGTTHLFYHDLNYYYPELQDKVIKQLSSGALEIMTGIIKHGITDGYFLNYLQPPAVIEVLTVLYASVTRSDNYKKFNLAPVELMKHTVGVYIKGICTEKGLQALKGTTYPII